MRKTLILNAAEVRRLVPLGDCIELMREALRSLSRGEVVQPLRTATWLPDRQGLLGLMPGDLGGTSAGGGVLGVKVVSVFPHNHERGLDSHQGAVLLFDVDNGGLLAVLDAGEITAIRTAAVSAVATDLLARPEARVLAILGSGVQAKMHLEALCLGAEIDRVRVWSRNSRKAMAFAEEQGEATGMSVVAAPTVAAAVVGADIICTVTAATEPILRGEWISPGTHINAVGACTPQARELDTAAVAGARLFVDWRESTVHESGDYLIPLQEGAISEEHILGEIGELLLGKKKGRTGAEEITLFKSLGVAVEDLAMAQAVYSRAREQGLEMEAGLAG